MSDSTIATVDAFSFDAKVFEATKPVLVLFTASWCRPATELEKILQQVAPDYETRMLIYKCDESESQLIEWGGMVPTVPTLQIYKNGERRAQYVGLLSTLKLKAWIESSLSSL